MPAMAAAALLVLVSSLLPVAVGAQGALLTTLSGSATVVLSWPDPEAAPRARVAAQDVLLGELARRGVRGWELAAEGETCDPSERACVHLLRSARPACPGHRSSATPTVSPSPDESFAVCASPNNITVVAATELGLMMAVGRLLREVSVVADGGASHVTLPQGLRLTVTPPVSAQARATQLYHGIS